MRRWLELIAGVTAIAVAGTALALTGPGGAGHEEAATDIGAKVEVTPTTVDEPIELKPIPPGMLGDYELPETRVVANDQVDDTPPPIAILHPEDGQVFEVREVVFEGTTEPGAMVFALEHEAEVRDDGSWRIVLHLSPGENEIIVRAEDSSGNHATDSVAVIYQEPEEPKKEEPKAEETKEEPKEEPKDEEPKEDETAWEFSAHQLYGECGESPPYDVFYGSGKAGSVIQVQSEFGSGKTEIGEHGEWEIKVIFEGAPVGEAFPVKVTDEFGNYAVFEFVRTG